MKKNKQVIILGRRQLSTADGSGTTEVTLVRLPAFTKSFKKEMKEVRDREKASMKMFAHG